MSSAVTVQSVVVQTLLTQLSTIYKWNILLFLPLVIVLGGCVLKMPTTPIMVLSSAVAGVLAMTVQNFSFANVLNACVSGFNLKMVDPAVFDISAAAPALKTIVNRGGMMGMTSMLITVYCAYVFGSIISCIGSLDFILQRLMTKVKSTGGLVTSAVASCILMALVTATSYLCLIIPGELFRDVFKKRGLASCNLSRTLEDSGTVFVPLLPWSNAGVYMAGTLGVAVVDYAPWAIMCYLGFVFAIILGFTGIGIEKINPEENIQAEA